MDIRSDLGEGITGSESAKSDAAVRAGNNE